MAYSLAAGVALAAAGTLTAVGAAGRWGSPSVWVAAWLASVSLTAFLFYGFDKWRARAGGRRLPELTLHALTVLGGGPGAYAGMAAFRHKTAKGRFRLVFWGLTACQVVLILWALAAHFGGVGSPGG